ncbi:unnamed protein product [Strongylus vulgaris]|uniref:Uncharacterized protein n=1 Tax=Strongylus vulgaris TaxID=40348 RepID=A0A3P7KPQ6_STRVU|nr:unnamed protein product [Strongylus vulgaris]
MIVLECSELGPITNAAQLFEQCAGEPFIAPRPGTILHVDLSKLTEQQLHELFANMVEMQICITVEGSSVKSLRFPRLIRWLPCANGKPALTLVYNYFLENVQFPKCKRGCIKNAIIKNNPKLPSTIIEEILTWCNQCEVIYTEPSCGLSGVGYSMIDFVRACAGKEVIVPRREMIIIDSSKVSEEEMNAFCSNAVYMEVCITVTMTDYRSLRCPRLRYMKSCRPGTPVFTIVQNPYLSVVKIPPNVRYPENEKILLVGMNQKLPSVNIKALKKICPHCQIEGFFSKCSALGPIKNGAVLFEQCAGEPFIAPRPGTILDVDLSKLTEQQLQELFANMVEMQICITIKGSSAKSLRFPRLMRWLPCANG